MTDKQDRLPRLKIYPEFAEVNLPAREKFRLPEKTLQDYKDISLNQLVREEKKIWLEILRRFRKMGS